MRKLILLLAIAMYSSLAFGQGAVYVPPNKGFTFPAPGSIGLCWVSLSSTTYGWGSCAGVASTNFSDLVGGTLASQALVLGAGSSISFSSTGTVNANKLNGVTLSGLATGIVKITTATGVPSIAVAADFPVLNQNSTGSSAKWTTARALAGNSVDGSAAVPFANKFIVQGTTDTGLSGAQFLGALSTGFVFNTTATGVLSVVAPSGAKCYVFGGSGGTGCDTPSGAGTVTSSGSPASGNIAKFTTGTNIAPAAYTDIVALFGSGSCSGFLKNDGTCAAGTGGITNGAGLNVLTKSDGTNLVASSLSDNGTTVSTPENFSFGTAAATAALGFNTTSGNNSLTTQSGANGLTWTLPSTTGTFAVSATSPLVLNATTGVLTCPTCPDTGTGLNQFAATSSAQLRGVLSDESGTGAALFAGGNIGAATATSLNGLTINTTTGTFALANGKTLTVNNTFTFSGTDSTTMTFPTVNATIPRIVASGTSSLGTSSISTASCATVVTTTATGAASTDAIIWTPNGSIKAVTGYVPATTGGLTIAAYATTNNVNFDVCNWTSGSVTPGAVVLNWAVVRQ